MKKPGLPRRRRELSRSALTAKRGRKDVGGKTANGQLKSRSTRSASLRRKPRKPSETLRIYGPPARRKWIKSLPCLACAAVHPLSGDATRGECHNAHTVSGGKGRKADACTIVPLCASHHRRYDEHKVPFDTPEARQAMKDAAAAIDSRWKLESAA